MTEETMQRPPRVARTRTDGQTTDPASVHCYARRASGLHAIGLEEAVVEFGRARHDTSHEAVLWIDVICPGPAEEQFLRDRLGLHQLAVEDCMRGRQRPKLDRFPGYFFLVAYTAWINKERNRTALEELHVFVGDGWIVTVHDHKLRLVAEVIARWRSNENAFPETSMLAHALLDGVVDSYLPVIDHLGVSVDEIEHLILSDSTDDHMPRLLELRHEVATTRRALSPLQEIVRVMVRRDAEATDDKMSPYFMDILDHVKRETEELDALRDTLAASLNAYLSVSANKLNQTLRIMASWSIILMAMAWLAGIYGMNFKVMPELTWTYGYPWALGLMFFVGGTLIYLFRRRGWL